MSLTVRFRDPSVSAQVGYTSIRIRDGYASIAVGDLTARWLRILRGEHILGSI